MALKLTSLDPVLEGRIKATQQGMAHWAGTGPALRTCRECNHYTQEGYYSKTGKNHGSLKPGICAKYRSMMNNKPGPKIDPNLPSCKYFDENPKPPNPVTKW